MLNFYVAQVSKVRKTKKKRGTASSGEDTDGDQTNDEGIVPPAPRPKPRRVTRSNPNVDGDVEESTGDERAPVTPKARPRPRPKDAKTLPEANLEGEDEPSQTSQPGSPMEAGTPPDAPEPDQALVTPKSARKRPRSDDEDMDELPNGTEDAPESPAEPEIQVRRKRIRH